MFQRETLSGRTASELVSLTAGRASSDTDPGAVALGAWAEAEVNDRCAGELFDRLRGWLVSGDPLPTVDVSWMLTAATAATGLGDTEELSVLASQWLLAQRGSHGVFPHALPSTSQPRGRSHIGSFADQVSLAAKRAARPGAACDSVASGSPAHTTSCGVEVVDVARAVRAQCVLDRCDGCTSVPTRTEGLAARKPQLGHSTW